MNTKNEKKKILTNKRTKSPFKKDKEAYNFNMYKSELNITLPNKDFDFLESSTNNYIHDITEEKQKQKNLPLSSKKAFLSKLNNNINNFGFTDSTYMFPINNRDLSILTDSNIFNINTNNSNRTSSNNINKGKNMNLNSNNLSNNNTQALLDDDLSYQTEPYDSKYSIKINKIKDDYIDFLQKEFEDNTKKSVKLDSNNKELLKRCDDLIHDNRILSNTLNDRTSKLNIIIQENLMIKSELDKSLLTNQKYEKKLEFYEEQFNLFKTSNDNYQKIINELKEQNEQLNSKLIKLEKENDENLNKAEENFRNQLKEEIENTKKEMEEIYNHKNMELKEQNDQKEQSFIEQIKELEEKNEKLENDLNNKNNMFDLVCKENEKLTNENNLIRTQADQNSRQINELNTIIKHKDNIINNLKNENLNNDKFLNKSSSCSVMKFDGNEYINENITKLITDNEENKMKIELLNDKLKSIEEIERKYNEIINGARTISLSEKLASQINSNNTSPRSNVTTHFNYNNLNNVNNIKNTRNSTYQKNTGNKNNNNIINKNFISPKKLSLHIGLNDANTPNLSRNKYEKTDFNYIPDKDFKSTNKTKRNNVIIFSSNINRDNKRKIIKDNIINPKKEKNNKINFDKEMKITKIGNNKISEREVGNINKTKKAEVITTPIKGRYYHKIEENKNKENEPKEKLVFNGKVIETEKDEVKDSLKEINKKKNYTHKPKIINYSLNETPEQKNEEQIIEIGQSQPNLIEEEKKANLYLYGIDRNNFLHTFDINNRKWCGIKKILDLDDKSDTFKKDYQYEGTLLYNTLNGVYILTGEKVDTLYYFNSQTNNIIKICKFNYSHDNGSIMYDINNNCIYAFGGKKITSCEYYSFSDKKVYILPDLITDRANASFIISNNKIFGFFGFSYSKNNYAKTIEYMDYTKKDKWYELNNIKLLKDDISFNIESISTMYYRQNPNQILIYCGIQGEEEDFVTEYYLLYDVIYNTIDKINKWNMQQFRSIAKKWKIYNFKSNDPKGFHFAKNTRFLLLPKGNYEGYNERDPIDIMIDYKNNVHYILQEKQKIDIYRSDM